MNQTEIILDEQKYRLRVVESLARLETLAESTENHLARLNGSVARHEDRLAVLWETVTRHPVECPLRAELQRLSAVIVADEASAKATEKWWKRISPLIWLGVGGLLVLFLVHSQDLLRALAR